MRDGVDDILDQWRRERPDLDVSPIGVIGRLSRTTDAVESCLARNFADHGLDAAAYDVLATLVRSGRPYELSPAALAATAMITSSAVAQRLNKLVARGLVTRAANPDDKRGTIVRLTPAGKEALERTLPQHLRVEHALLAGVSDEERALLIGLLQRLERNARALIEDRGASSRHEH